MRREDFARDAFDPFDGALADDRDRELVELVPGLDFDFALFNASFLDFKFSTRWTSDQQKE